MLEISQQHLYIFHPWENNPFHLDYSLTGAKLVFIFLLFTCTVLEIQPNTWLSHVSGKNAGLTDKEPVWGWAHSTPCPYRGLHSKGTRKPESPFPSTRYSLESSPTDTGCAHHCLKQSWSSRFSSSEPNSKAPLICRPASLEHISSDYRFPMVTNYKELKVRYKTLSYLPSWTSNLVYKFWVPI